MVARSEVYENARLAGLVKRYHTWPLISAETVAAHTWQVIRLWWQIFGPLPPHISTYAIWHDCGELVTGDLPFPIKRRNEHLGRIMDELEHGAVLAMGGPEDMKLEPYDKLRFKCCDNLDMLELGLHELRLGNEYARPIVKDTKELVEAAQNKLDISDSVRLGSYLNRYILPAWNATMKGGA